MAVYKIAIGAHFVPLPAPEREGVRRHRQPSETGTTGCIDIDVHQDVHFQWTILETLCRHVERGSSVESALSLSREP
jgi:hypothetical protein